MARSVMSKATKTMATRKTAPAMKAATKKTAMKAKSKQPAMKAKSKQPAMKAKSKQPAMKAKTKQRAMKTVAKKPVGKPMKAAPKKKILKKVEKKRPMKSVSISSMKTRASLNSNYTEATDENEPVSGISISSDTSSAGISELRCKNVRPFVFEEAHVKSATRKNSSNTENSKSRKAMKAETFLFGSSAGDNELHFPDVEYSVPDSETKFVVSKRSPFRVVTVPEISEAAFKEAVVANNNRSADAEDAENAGGGGSCGTPKVRNIWATSSHLDSQISSNYQATSVVTQNSIYTHQSITTENAADKHLVRPGYPCDKPRYMPYSVYKISSSAIKGKVKNPKEDDPSSWYPADDCVAGKSSRGPRLKKSKNQMSQLLHKHNLDNRASIVDYNAKNFKIICVHYKLDENFEGAAWDDKTVVPVSWALSDKEYYTGNANFRGEVVVPSAEKETQLREFPGTLKFAGHIGCLSEMLDIIVNRMEGLKEHGLIHYFIADTLAEKPVCNNEKCKCRSIASNKPSASSAFTCEASPEDMASTTLPSPGEDFSEMDVNTAGAESDYVEELRDFLDEEVMENDAQKASAA